MDPTLALFLWFISLVVLLYVDPAKDKHVSAAIWVPVIWMFILATRLPSQWLGGSVADAAQAMEEGNPIDRTISSALILLSIAILVSRSFRWGDLFGRNLALTAFLSFALLSVIWADAPFIAFKRWFRDLGNYLVILVALADRRPLEALRTLLRRLSYLLVPLSILLVKYYPQIGRQYDAWQGTAMYVGPTTSKNMLGVLCLISGLFFFWDTITRWSERKSRRTKKILLVNLAFFGMTLWLLNMANSATSKICLAFGCVLIVAAHTSFMQRHPNILKVMVPATLVIYVVMALGFGVNAQLAGAVGRDPTLTDRTKIWGLLLTMHTDPLLGTGYENFWLGPRLITIWRRFGPLNEAHNGYLEVYLNLGLIGVSLLVGFLLASYRTICRKLKPFSSFGSLALALWTILLLYNVSEAAFKGGLMWLTFLMGAIAVPGVTRGGIRTVTAVKKTDLDTERVSVSV